MGWFNRLGHAITGGVQKLGHAVHHGVDAAVRLVDHVAPQVQHVADTIAKGAGVVANMATAAVPFVQAIPVVGEVVDAVAIGARAAQGVAKGVSAGAKFVQGAANTAKAVRTIERDAGKAVKMGKDFMANPNMHDAKRYGHEMSSMVRHNAANVREARDRYKSIRGGP